MQIYTGSLQIHIVFIHFSTVTGNKDHCVVAVDSTQMDPLYWIIKTVKRVVKCLGSVELFPDENQALLSSGRQLISRGSLIIFGHQARSNVMLLGNGGRLPFWAQIEFVPTIILVKDCPAGRKFNWTSLQQAGLGEQGTVVRFYTVVTQVSGLCPN